MVSRPDKGKGIIIVAKQNYINYLLGNLADNSNFEEVVEPITKAVQSIEDQINDFLRKLKSLTKINQSIYGDFYVSGSSLGILYRLPKIHKLDFNVNFQYRPIFAA